MLDSLSHQLGCVRHDSDPTGGAKSAKNEISESGYSWAHTFRLLGASENRDQRCFQVPSSSGFEPALRFRSAVSMWSFTQAVTATSGRRIGARALAISGGTLFGVSYLASVLGAFVVAADIGRHDLVVAAIVGGTTTLPVLGPVLVGNSVRSETVNALRAGFFIDAGVQLVGLSLLILGLVLDRTEVKLSDSTSVNFLENGLVQLRF